MSQHLIIDFINRTYVFKPFNDGKIVNRKIKKIEGSNRKNNISPEMFAESTHPLRKISVKKVKEKDPQEETEGHIDIII